jgi:hypothetical protein
MVHDRVYGISKVALSIYLKQIKDFGAEKALIETGEFSDRNSEDHNL